MTPDRISSVREFKDFISKLLATPDEDIAFATIVSGIACYEDETHRGISGTGMVMGPATLVVAGLVSILTQALGDAEDPEKLIELAIEAIAKGKKTEIQQKAAAITTDLLTTIKSTLH